MANTKALIVHSNGSRKVTHNGSRRSNVSRARARRLARWQAVFLKALRQSPNISWACRKSAVSRFTAYKHYQDNAAFAAKWDAALSASVDRCEEKAFDMAWKGDSQLLQFILKAHRPERYRESSRIEVDQRVCGVLIVPPKEDLPP